LVSREDGSLLRWDLAFSALAFWRIGFWDACLRHAIFFSGFQQTLIHSSIQYATLSVISKPPMAGEKPYEVSGE